MQAYGIKFKGDLVQRAFETREKAERGIMELTTMLRSAGILASWDIADFTVVEVNITEIKEK